MNREEINNYLKRYEGIDFTDVPMLEFTGDGEERPVYIKLVALDETASARCEKKTGDGLILLFQMTKNQAGKWEKGKRPKAALRVHNAATIDGIISWLRKIKKQMERK